MNVRAVGQLEVVVEAVLDRRADRELRAREQLRHGLRHHVRRRVAQHVATRLGVGGDDRHVRAVGQRSPEIPLLAVDRPGDRRLGQARPDRRRHVRGGRALGERALRTVGEGDRDLCHTGTVYERPPRRSGSSRRRASSPARPAPRGRRRSASPVRDGDDGRLGLGLLPAYTLRYSWPVSSRISNISSSVIWRSTRWSSARRGSARLDRAADLDRALRRPWAASRRAAGSRGADDADREDRAADLQRQPRRPCGPCTGSRRGCACPRGRCRTAPRAAPLGGVERAWLVAAARSIGIMPIAGNRNFVFHESMYSALPTKLMLRGSIRNALSRKLTWLGTGSPDRRRHRSKPRGERPQPLPRATQRGTGLSLRPSRPCPERRAAVGLVARRPRTASRDRRRAAPRRTDVAPRPQRRRSPRPPSACRGRRRARAHVVEQ